MLCGSWALGFVMVSMKTKERDTWEEGASARVSITRLYHWCRQAGRQAPSARGATQSMCRWGGSVTSDKLFSSISLSRRPPLSPLFASDCPCWWSTVSMCDVLDSGSRRPQQKKQKKQKKNGTICFFLLLFCAWARGRNSQLGGVSFSLSPLRHSYGGGAEHTQQQL